MSEDGGQKSRAVTNRWIETMQQLLEQSRISFLASSGEYGPETTMAPFAIHHGNVLLHLSSLSKHRANIERESRIGIMICTPESMGESPLALPRISLQGSVKSVAEGEFADAKNSYLKSIPDAEALFSFADFQLFQFTPVHIHWVGGFGKARTVSLQQWQRM